MIIEHFGGTEYASNADELCMVLNKRYGNGVNEFWISEEKMDIPCMTILVNKNLANVTYFPDSNSPGYQSVGNKKNPKDSSVFYVNTPDEEIEIFNDTIISFQDALKAAIEFFQNNQMPTCIEWTEN